MNSSADNGRDWSYLLIFAIVEHVKAGRMFLDFGTRDRDLSDVSAPDAARANKKPPPSYGTPRAGRTSARSCDLAQRRVLGATNRTRPQGGNVTAALTEASSEGCCSPRIRQAVGW